MWRSRSPSTARPGRGLRGRRRLIALIGRRHRGTDGCLRSTAWAATSRVGPAGAARREHGGARARARRSRRSSRSSRWRSAACFGAHLPRGQPAARWRSTRRPGGARRDRRALARRRPLMIALSAQSVALARSARGAMTRSPRRPIAHLSGAPVRARRPVVRRPAWLGFSPVAALSAAGAVAVAAALCALALGDVTSLFAGACARRPGCRALRGLDRGGDALAGFARRRRRPAGPAAAQRAVEHHRRRRADPSV